MRSLDGPVAFTRVCGLSTAALRASSNALFGPQHLPLKPMIIGIYSPAAQSGKTTVASFLQERGYCRLPFAQPMRDMLSVMLSDLGYSEELIAHHLHVDKEALVPELGVSVRHLLRTLGTEWGRDCVSPSVWLDVWLAKARRKSFVVVDDVRFTNEAELIRLLGGQVWRITRPGVVRNTEHASEGGLDEWEHFTCDIVNSGSISDLLNGLPKVPFGPHGLAAPEGGLAGTA